MRVTALFCLLLRLIRHVTRIANGRRYLSGKIRRRQIVWLFLCCLWLQPGIAAAQSDSEHQLQITLRHSDGTAVAGEPVILERLPAEVASAGAQLSACTTDAQGTCAWWVGRGLFQVLFDRPLDAVSALAVAEGGLRGFGITVGDEPISYHFTFQNDGHVYFDAAPNAAIPDPIIPLADALQGGLGATPVLPVTYEEAATTTPTPTPAGPTATIDSWYLLLFVAGGLVIGGGLHILRRRSGQVWSRRRRQGKTSHIRPTQPIRNPKSEIDVQQAVRQSSRTTQPSRNQEASDA